MYGVAKLPLIDMPDFQSWTRHGAQVAGSHESLQSLQNTLDKVIDFGGAFGYNVMKYHLITNRKFLRRLKNWIFLKLDNNIIEAHSALSPVIGFW